MPRYGSLDTSGFSCHLVRDLPTFCPQVLTYRGGQRWFTVPIRPRDFAGRAIPSSWAMNHDFFSGSGSSYVIGKAEATEDDDWDF